VRDVLDELLTVWKAGGTAGVATVVRTIRSAPRPPGATMVVAPDGTVAGSVSGGCVESDVSARAAEVLADGRPQLLPYGISDDQAFGVGLPCGGEIEVFVAPLDREELDRVAAAEEAGERLSVTTTLTGDDAGRKAYGAGEAHASARRDGDELVEHYAPPPVLMIFGAVDTAQALCSMARQVGFRTVVSDARPRFATRERVPDGRTTTSSPVVRMPPATCPA
jgi:xanthine dehydrogenase accessory factor